MEGLQKMSEKNQSGYSQDKMRRIAVGATIAGVLLVVFLIVILIIQFVQIGRRNRELDEYEALIEEYKSANEKDEKKLDDFLNGDALYLLALRRGFRSPE